MRVAGICAAAVFSPFHYRPVSSGNGAAVRRDGIQLSAQGEKNAYDDQIRLLEKQRDILTESKKELQANLRKLDTADDAAKKALQEKIKLTDNQLNEISAQLTQLQLRREQAEAEKSTGQEGAYPTRQDECSEAEKQAVQLTKDILSVDSARQAFTQAAKLKITAARMREQAGWQAQWAEENEAFAAAEHAANIPARGLDKLQQGLAGVEAAMLQQINHAQEPEADKTDSACNGGFTVRKENGVEETCPASRETVKELSAGESV